MVRDARPLTWESNEGGGQTPGDRETRTRERKECIDCRGGAAGVGAGQARPPHSESLLSELDPLELLLADSEELLLLSREGPPGGAAPDFSGGEAEGEGLCLRPWTAPFPATRSTTPSPLHLVQHMQFHTPLHTTHPRPGPATR